MPKKKAPEIVFEPANEVQDDFIWSTKRESIFDGGIGNGKTTGGIMKLLILAREFPGSSWVIARQTYKDLIATTKKTFEKVCPPHWIKRDVKEEMTLANGSEIHWLHLDDMSEGSLRGLEINGAFVSQAEEIAPEMWEFLDSRIGRWDKQEWPTRCPAYIWGDCNPNGHDWLYFRFHPDCIGVNHPTRAYFFGETGINKAVLDRISPGYYDKLMSKPDAWKRRWVFGSRDIFEGAIHPDFRKEIHVYDADRFDPLDALNIKSCWGWFDYGLSAPTCLLLSASTSDNFHFITHEYYRQSTPGRTITIREHAAAILKMTREHRYPVRGIYGDPSIFWEDTRDRRTATTSVAQEYREAGVYMTRADNNEISSIANLQQLMHVENVMNPVTRLMGSPRIFISSRCENLIEQIQLQRHAETRNPLTGEKEFTEERAVGIPDHAYDPFRYFANSNVWQPPMLRDQPRIPAYRTMPMVDKAVKGYGHVGHSPRMSRNYNWRELPNVPQPERYTQ